MIWGCLIIGYVYGVRINMFRNFLPWNIKAVDRVRSVVGPPAVTLGDD